MARKLRDYRVEHERRSITQAARKAHVSAWRLHTLRRLRRLLAPDEIRLTRHDGDVKKLLDIALVDPAAAKKVNGNHEEISAAWQEYKLVSAISRRRRKDWLQRMTDAFPGWYQRWLTRFDSDELELVRYNTALFCFDQLSAKQKKQFLEEMSELQEEETSEEK
jgi:hypothetical protein